MAQALPVLQPLAASGLTETGFLAQLQVTTRSLEDSDFDCGTGSEPAALGSVLYTSSTTGPGGARATG